MDKCTMTINCEGIHVINARVAAHNNDLSSLVPSFCFLPQLLKYIV